MSFEDYPEVVCVDPGSYVVRTTEGMQRLGELLGGILREGDVVVLTGDLGAGKTQLTKGVARGMGIRDVVTSPTFTIMMAYQGQDMPLYHFDLYRIQDFDELYDTGLFDVLGEGGVCMLEWGEQFSRAIGEERLDVILTRMDEGEELELGEEPPRLVELIACDMRASNIVDELARRFAAQEGEAS